MKAHFVMWCTSEKLVLLAFGITFPHSSTSLLCQLVVTVGLWSVCVRDCIFSFFAKGNVFVQMQYEVLKLRIMYSILL